MEDNKLERAKRASRFGRKFKELEEKKEVELQKDLSTSEIAKMCNLTYHHLNNIISGIRTPSLDVLCSLAAGMEVPFDEIASYLVSDIKSDNGGRFVSALIVNNGRGPTAGAFDKIRETEIEEYYSVEYNPEEFLKYIRKYLVDVKYKGKYEKCMEEKKKVVQKEKLLNKLSLDNPLLNETVELLYSLDETGVKFVSEQIRIYLSLKK